MGSVLIDNWSLESLIARKVEADNEKKPKAEYDIRSFQLIYGPAEGYEHQDTYNPGCWQNILMSIVLWDDIRYILNADYGSIYYRYTTEALKQFRGLIKPLYYKGEMAVISDMDFELLRSLSDREFSCASLQLPIKKLPPGLNDRKKYMDLMDGTYLYLLHSSNCSVNYLPHPIRAQFIKDNDGLEELYSRDVLLQMVDREVLEFYNHVNDLIKRRIFRCSYPILYDYIRQNACSEDEELDAAFSIRSSRDVVQFRKALDELDKKVNSGDVAALSTALKQIQELAHQITAAYSKTTELGELSIGLSPTINIPLKISTKKKAIHMTFLSKLIEYGIHDRLRR